MTKKTIKPREYFVPKYTKKVVEFLTDKIEGGMTLSQVCEEYGPPTCDLVPNEKTCYRWMKKYPDFKKQVNEAYKTLLMCLIDKKLRLSERAQALAVLINQTLDKPPTIAENGKIVWDSTIDDAIKKAKFEIEAIKVQQKALEFTLTRIAPKFVEDLKESPEQSRLAQLPPLTIINYATPKDNHSSNDLGLLIDYEKNK